jgi:Glycosyltransferase family 87
VQRLTRLGALTLACACVGNMLAEAARGLRDAFNTDFLSSFYTAADMLRHGDHAIYCSACLQAAAQRLFHAGPAVFSFQYDNPPLGAWLLQPLTYLGSQTALAFFLLASLVALGAAGWLLRDDIRRTPNHILIAVVAFASFPAAMTFAYGQWDGFLTLAATGAYVALRHDRQVLAGLLISVLMLKPQLMWLVPVVVVIAGSWRVLYGMVVGGLIWGLSSVAILGWPDTVLWLRQISPNIVARTGLSLPHVLVAFGATSSLVVSASVVLLVVTAVALFAARRWLRSLELERLLSLGLLFSMLAAPHLLSYDLIILAPLIVIWGRTNEFHALGAALVLSAAFLVDLVLPMSWAIVEGLALLGVAFLYCHDIWSAPASDLADPTRRLGATLLRVGESTARDVGSARV